VVKLKLLRSYCSDIYGSVLETWHILLWCITWRKGLKLVWELPIPALALV